MGMLARAGKHFGAPGVHHHAAIRLLIVADAHHVHRALEPKELAGERQRAAPLAGAGFRGQPLDAGALVVIRLRNRGVRLVAARRTGAFVLVIDMRRRIQQLLQAARAIERRGAPQAIDVHHFAWNIDQRLGRKFLLDQFHRKERQQVLRRQRRACPGMKRRVHRFRQRRQNVDPHGRNLAIRKQEFGVLGHGRDYYNRRTLAFNAEVQSKRRKTRPVFLLSPRLRVESVSLTARYDASYPNA